VGAEKEGSARHRESFIQGSFYGTHEKGVGGRKKNKNNINPVGKNEPPIGRK